MTVEARDIAFGTSILVCVSMLWVMWRALYPAADAGMNIREQAWWAYGAWFAAMLALFAVYEAWGFIDDHLGFPTLSTVATEDVIEGPLAWLAYLFAAAFGGTFAWLAFVHWWLTRRAKPGLDLREAGTIAAGIAIMVIATAYGRAHTDERILRALRDGGWWEQDVLLPKAGFGHKRTSMGVAAVNRLHAKGLVEQRVSVTVPGSVDWRLVAR